MMPVAEFEGRFGWGYDGVDLYAPSHRYGTPDDLRSVRRSGPRRPASASFSTSSTTISGRPAITSREFCAGVLHRSVRERVGRRDQLRRRRCRDRCASSSSDNAGVLDRRVSHRRPAPRRNPADLRCARESTSWPRSGRGFDARRARARRSSSPRTSRRIRGSSAPARRRRLRPRCAVERRLSSQRDGRAHRARRGLLQRHARHATGVDLGREVRLSLSGTALRLAAPAARDARARPRAGAFRHVSSEPRSGRQLRDGPPRAIT